MKLRILCVAICLTMVLGLTGCDKESGYPQGYEEYLAIVGETKADALNKLKLQESELTEVVLYTYQAPGTFEFSGYNFELALLLDRAFDRIYGFTYWTMVDDLSGLTAMREKLIELYGEPADYNFTQDLLDKLIADKEGTVGNTWSMYRFTEEHHPEYAKCLEQMNQAYGMDQVYAWNLVMQADCNDDGRFLITMTFSVGPDYTASWQPGQPRE